MNQECKELVRLYEVMHTCSGSESDRTEATIAFEASANKSACGHGLDVRVVISHIKECYFKQLRAEDQHTDKRPLIKD